MTALTLPDDWLVDIEDAIAHPERFKWVGFDNETEGEKDKQVVIPSELREKYDTFHSRAIAHSRTKGEHEIACLFNFYIIWRYKLWRAEYTNWGEYVEDMSYMPFGVSVSTINHGVLDIDRFIEAGMTVRNLISSYSVAKGATKRLLETPASEMPGQDINKAAEVLSELGPEQANRTVDDWQKKVSMFPLSATHDSQNNRLYWDIRKTFAEGNWVKKDYMIADMERDEAEWFMEKMHIPYSQRTFK